MKPPEAPELAPEGDEGASVRAPYFILFVGTLCTAWFFWQAYSSCMPLSKRIAEIRVGQRVRSSNPTGEKDLSFGATINQSTWKKVSLRAPKADGSFADVVLLRPKEWLHAQKAKVGGTLEVSVPECGIDGNATVLAIETCPQIERGEGRVVTGTFRHEAALVYDLRISGETKPIGTTGNHPFWSEDRQDFVPAAELRNGEQLRTLQGLATVASIIPRGPPQPVYNIEVEVTHTYHVGHQGVLVHNARPKCPANRTPFDKDFYDNQYHKFTHRDELVDAPPWRREDGYIEPEGHADANPRHGYQPSKIEQMDVLNNWERSWTGLNKNGRPVDIYWKSIPGESDGLAVITERGNKASRITSYKVDHERWSDRSRWRTKAGGDFQDELYKAFRRNTQR